MRNKVEVRPTRMRSKVEPTLTAMQKSVPLTAHLVAITALDSPVLW